MHDPGDPENYDEYAIDPERVRRLREQARIHISRIVSARPAKFNALAQAIVSKLAALWHLNEEEATGLFSDIQPGRDLTEGQFIRLSALLGIRKALHVWFSLPLADDWPLRPNTAPTFKGRRPLDVMIEGGLDKILETRLHLDQNRPWTVEEIEQVWGIKIELPTDYHGGRREEE